MNQDILVAKTAVSGTSYSFDELFSYIVPEPMIDTIKIGCRVIVPFGRGNKNKTAVVMDLTYVNSSERLKKLLVQVDKNPVLAPEMIELALYLREQTFCSYYDAVKTMLPPGLNLIITEQLELNKDFKSLEILNEKEKNLYEKLLIAKNSSQFNKIINDSMDRDSVDSLVNKNVLVLTNKHKNAVGDSIVKMIRLSDGYINEPHKFKLTPKQKIVAEALQECISASEKELSYMCGVTMSVVKRLVENKIAVEFENEIFRKATEDVSEKRDIKDVVLSDEQQQAFEKVNEKMTASQSACFLLHGVTGSGKTSVFEKLINETVNNGKTALLLIPEIALTPQILNRFKSLFGDRIAVIHSSLSMGQRYDEYKRIQQGLADIVIGTRSAIFAPLKNIGIIIMDEEGERSYKSDSSPRYNTSDVARQRCRFHNAVLLLASATPSIESYYKTQRNIYNLIELKNRYHNSKLPDVEIVDMTLERQKGNKTEFSNALVEAINQNLEAKEQSIILLNRRGYHTIISCIDCYQPVYCKNCTVPMTYHKKNGKLMCHYCGYTSEIVTVCNNCGSQNFKMLGFGTQRLEEELNMIFPTAKILRMDADTTFSRDSYEKSFRDFANGEYDIMIGTQMIGKGLDFPNVTLVGILSVDNALYAGDFRSYERTFSLITQVVGRSGRDGRQGKAYLQTFMPDHYVIELAARQDYKQFYEEEISVRRALTYPPICDICVLGFAGIDDDLVTIATQTVIRIISELLEILKLKTPLRVIGPIKCSHLRINGKFRHRIILKCKNTSEMRNFISTLLKESHKHKELSKITLYADMNGDIGI